MNINTLLINPEYVKKYSTVGDNVQPEYITPAIIDAQLIYLQPMIGTMLYDNLCTMVSDNILTADYRELLDNYIAPYLIKVTQAQLLLNLYVKQRNAGVVSYLDTNQQQTDISTVKYLKSEYDSEAEFYANRLMDYLCANSSKFPEYRNRRDCADMPSDRANTAHNQLNYHKITRKGKI